MKKQAFNPFLPSWEYIPDGEPHVFGDRVYLYGSHDHFRGYVYCLGDYACWSAPVDDLGDWRYEGIIYRREQDPRNTDGKMVLFAPDVVQGTDGRYYMYYIPNLSHIVSVAVCDTPAGKYEFYGFVRHADGNILGERKGDAPQFDPGVYREGQQTYLYTGFCPAQDASTEGPAVTILAPDMLTITEEPKTVIPNTCHAKGTSFEGHAFFEASSMRRRGDTYYFIYSSVHNHEMCYATAQAPVGPFTYRGVIVDNCDAGIDSYKAAGLKTALHCNNHGSFTEINGRWYMFYHRPTNGTQFSRQACAEEIFFTPEGLIRQTEMTSCGLNGGPLESGVFYDAYIACNLWNIYPAFQDDEKYRPMISQDGNDGDELPGYVCNMTDGATAGFKYFDCKGITKIDIKARGYMDGCFEVRTSPDGEICSRIEISECNYWETFTAPCHIPDGIHAIYITHVGGRIPTLGGFKLY
ncbi:family 43 glycosylhydrolase [Lachnospiraceae bacterium 38-10]